MWSKLKRAGVVVAAVVGFIAAMIAIADEWSFTRLARWLYPVGVIVGLLIVLLVVAAMLFWRRRSPWSYAADGEREHDRRVVRDVRSALSRDQAEDFRGIDFGGRWRGELVYPLQALAGIDDVEHRPHAPSLRDALEKLFRVTAAFRASYRVNTFLAQSGGQPGEDWRDAGWSPMEADGLEGDDRSLWLERRETLNQLADELVDAYDELMTAARDMGVVEL